MGLRFRAAIGALAYVGIIACAFAQDKNGASTDLRRPTLTGKERLGPKWTDEQRIDNCHVPVDKRGAKQRPSVCPNDPRS